MRPVAPAHPRADDPAHAVVVPLGVCVLLVRVVLARPAHRPVAVRVPAINSQRQRRGIRPHAVRIAPAP